MSRCAQRGAHRYWASSWVEVLMTYMAARRSGWRVTHKPNALAFTIASLVGLGLSSPASAQRTTEVVTARYEPAARVLVVEGTRSAHNSAHSHTGATEALMVLKAARAGCQASTGSWLTTSVERTWLARCHATELDVANATLDDIEDYREALIGAGCQLLPADLAGARAGGYGGGE